MTRMIEKAGLQVGEPLARFIDERALPGLGITPRVFWEGLADIYARFTAENRALLAKRDRLQSQIDAWHSAARGRPIDPAAYQAFLREIGYLVDEPAAFQISTGEVDDEVARQAGPQLVVPALNARFVINAANARWGSLYDAYYGTDAIGGPPAGADYDPARGAWVVSHAKMFLDRVVPLEGLSWAEVSAVKVSGACLAAQGADPSHWVGLTQASAFTGYTGAGAEPSSVILTHHGLHIELSFDRTHPVGMNDPAGLADILLEAALTTIVDLEDSVATVDAEDKTAAYDNWLGLMRGDLEARFVKAGRTMVRTLADDRTFTTPTGRTATAPGRSLLFIRNVGHAMTTPAVRLSNGDDAFEGILDGVVTSLIALHDLKRKRTNSRAGSVYIVKPKMHGPEEAAFTNRLFDAIEDLLGLARHTLKIGLMDEERRTSANLAACIEALKHRLVFINTGFLDRTGDEIHTVMQAGPVVRKGEMKDCTWIKAYEDRNVQIGLACGLSGKAQIGKGMWAAPDRMADMLKQKFAHPMSGASTAWTPSPTAAVLHALHYHAVDVFERQAERRRETPASLEALLTPPLAEDRAWLAAEIADELDNNGQGILGYVVRWVDQGIGCSKVPDIHDIGLMEDRATLRISSQHIANWLLHGVCSVSDVDAALRRMAAKVDTQNSADPAYRPMAGDQGRSVAFQAARALIFSGSAQPSGYTEPLLQAYRAKVKAEALRGRQRPARGALIAVGAIAPP